MNRNSFKYNTYTKNVATNGKGILTIIGSPRTFFDYETFESNGDASYESTATYGANWYIFPHTTESTGEAIYSTTGYNQNLLKNSLIQIQRST